jgi:hypothetical protein
LHLRIFCTPIFQAFVEGICPHVSRPLILHLGMVTHSYCRNWQSVTFRNVGFQLFSSVCFHFKFMNRITNSGPNLKVASKRMPSKNSSHNFCTSAFGQKSSKIMRVDTVNCV